MTLTAGQGYEEAFEAAVKLFWDTRDQQAKEQLARGVADTGTRGAVTGGAHLLPMAAVVEQVFNDAGVAPTGTNHSLPGYYRQNKVWDGVVTYKGAIVAIVELKSQVGSFGNNQNNRIEEMIGQARDINVAANRDLLGELPPWFAYLMLVEDAARSNLPVRPRIPPNPAFPSDAVFASNPSYIDRYAIAFRRLLLEGDLQAVCLVASERTTKSVRYPDPTMSFTAFAAAIQGRVNTVRGALG